MRLQKIVMTWAIASSLSLGGLFAQAEEISNLEAISCWEVSTMAEDDAAYAWVLLYGYNGGANNQPLQSSNKISAAIVAAGEICDNNPDLPAIKAFGHDRHTFDTVSSVKTMGDDSHVVLEGRLLKKLKSGNFQFKDETGIIEVDIDKDDFERVFGRKRIAATMKVKLVGEVDKDGDLIEVDVDYIELAK